jgi:hypothetical protein
MKGRNVMLYLALLMTIIASLNLIGCAQNLPADFPRPPAITICTPIAKNGAFSHWACENTGTRETTSESLNFVQVGVSVDDWNKGQTYRREVETWIIKRCNHNFIGDL